MLAIFPLNGLPHHWVEVFCQHSFSSMDTLTCHTVIHCLEMEVVLLLNLFLWQSRLNPLKNKASEGGGVPFTNFPIMLTSSVRISTYHIFYAC